MKKQFFTFLLSLTFLSVYAGGGFFDSFAILNINGGGNTFYDLMATTGNADYQNANLGVFDASMQSIVLGGQTKTFKNNGTDIMGVSIFYRIYPNGSPSGAFTEIPYSFQFDNVGGTFGDQQWGTDALGANATDDGVEILSGTALTAGTYILEVYVQATTNGVDAPMTIFDNNGGSNYQASFLVSSQLPVTLTYFDAKLSNQTVELNWSTSSEINNSHFEVQRSYNAKDWATIQKVQGAGNSLETQHYQLIDQQPFDGINYYRLKQVDHDGTMDYSTTISVRFEAKSEKETVVYPTLINDNITIEQGRGEAILYDVAGRVIRSFSVQDEVQNIDVQDLTTGKYFLKITTTTGRVHTTWLVKQ